MGKKDAVLQLSKSKLMLKTISFVFSLGVGTEIGSHAGRDKESVSGVGGEIPSGQSERRNGQERGAKSILRSAASVRTVIEQPGQEAEEEQAVQRRALSLAAYDFSAVIYPPRSRLLFSFISLFFYKYVL